MDDRDARALVAHLDALLEHADEDATELAAALCDLYGEGLARLAALVPAPEALAGDELVSHLLLLHGIHPVPVEERVRAALAEVRPYLESHGGDVELLGVEDGVARLRLQGSCEGCPSSAATLALAVEEAIQKLAPDVDRIEADGAAAPAPPAAPRRAWAPAEALPAIDPGRALVHDVAGEPLLFVRLERRLYAYRPRCPGCAGSLEDGVLIGTVLGCPTCGSAFDVRRAGRCADAPELHLEPVPLLVDHEDRVKVALGAAAARAA